MSQPAPMPGTEFDIKYIARLARVQLDPDEEQKLAAQLQPIIGYIEKLKQLEVSGIEPTAHAVPLVNIMRPDQVQPSLLSADALRNAPSQGNELFIVPKIIE
jgi:aspartyl-tRNA(Asn)/glutamyl-tRNA(Gln) amidotransferase subunit C